MSLALPGAVRVSLPDLLRLALPVPLVAVALLGRGGLEVDAENLAMKSSGTADDQVAALRAELFGNEPSLVLLARSAAGSGADEAGLGAWLDGLREQPSVAGLDVLPPPEGVDLCVLVRPRCDEDGRYAGATADLTAAARATLPAGVELTVSGTPVVEVAIAEELRGERARLMPLLVGVLGALLLLLYRSPVLVLSALVAPLAGVVALEGLQGWLGLGIDPVSSLLGPAVLTVGLASGVHLVERYRRGLGSGLSVAAASAEAARRVRVPLTLATVTTVAGFLALQFSPIPAVRRFGLLGSIGCVLVLVLTLVVVPALLRAAHRPGAPTPPPHGRARVLRMTPRLARLVLVGFGALAVVGVLGLRSERGESDPLSVLSPHHRVRRDAEALSATLGGREVFELLLTPPGPTGPLATLGLVSAVTALDGVVGPAGTPRWAAHGHVLLPFLLASGRGVTVDAEAVLRRAEETATGAGWARADATGLAVRIARDSAQLIRAQREGILVTLGALWLVMAVGLRSVRLAFLGLVPNLLPVLLIQGSMGLVGLPLSVASSMIGTVMLGLVVDDTIHFLHAFQGAAGSALERTQHALTEVARPLIVSTTVLCAGFATTLLGSLQATREFGTLSTATLVIALAADLLLLPALLCVRPPRPSDLLGSPKTCARATSSTS